MSEFDCSGNEKYLTKHIYRRCCFFYFMVFFIVKITTYLMNYCLARCARNLVLFCFSFSNAEITKGFCDSR